MNNPSRATLRALDVFEKFAATGTPQSLSELARLVGIPVSTCHGLAKTLLERGYLYSIGSPRRLYPTKRLYGVAQRISDQDPIIEFVAPKLAGLRDATEETVILGKRQGNEVVYLEVLEGLNVIRYSARPGDLKPLHSSAIGKLILGELPEDKLEALLKRLKLERITENTIVDRDELVAELGKSKSRGYYLTEGENVSEVMAIAVPVQLSGETFGIAVAGPVARMKKGFEAHLAALVSCGKSIEAAFA
jgi:DNA-binding IclR family transcriptional regulator